MTPERWGKVKEIFEATLGRAPDEREAFLNGACVEDESLRPQVLALLAAHEKSDSFSDAPTYRSAASVFAHRQELETGQEFGHYRIISTLGKGGMGEVYLAEDTKLHRRVAIKFLTADSIANEEANHRLLREAQAAAKLDHPNICAVHEVAEENGRTFMVMTLVEGETLAARIKREPLELSAALNLACQVADAIAEAHAHGIIHRDLKPANVMITSRGQAKVMDFGLAKLSSPSIGTSGFDPASEGSTAVLLTQPGTIIGTVPYMSPEQVHGQRLDVRTDIFSFGALLYQMVSSQPPFAAESPAGVISAILTAEPPPLTQCPEDLRSVVNRCLEKDRERRYQTMRDVAADLENVRRQSEAGAFSLPITNTVSRQDPDGDQPRRSFYTSRPILALTAIVLLAVIAGSIWFWRYTRSASTANVKAANSPAYDYYLRGKVNNIANRESNDTAIKLLEQAVKADPNYAPAWAELARAYNVKTSYFATDAEKEKLNEDAKVAVEKSLALDPNLASAHVARGLVLWNEANRFPHEQAIQAFQRALALDPNLAEPHQQLAAIFGHIGLLEKADSEIKKALDIDPSYTSARARLGMNNLFRGRYDEALSVLKTIPPKNNPDMTNSEMAAALLGLGRTQDASNIIDDYLKNHPDNEASETISARAILLAQLGKPADAQSAIQRALEGGKGQQHFHHTTYNVACAYALLNKRDEAMKWLQFTADDGFPCYPLFEQDANLNSIRKDERFIAFMAKLKQQWERYKAMY